MMRWSPIGFGGLGFIENFDRSHQTKTHTNSE